jgi:hypothetical protein
MMRFDRGFHVSNSREVLLQIMQDPQRPEEWEEQMRKDNRVGYIDRMHEGYRRHPRTAEKHEHKYKVFQLLEDAAYRGKWQCIGVQHYRMSKHVFSLLIYIDILVIIKTKSSSTCTASATTGRTR